MAVVPSEELRTVLLMFVILSTSNFKFRNRSTCSKGPIKRAGKVCGDSQDLNHLVRGGCTACAGSGGGVFVCVGTGFHWSRVRQVRFWCSPIVCRTFGRQGLVSVYAGVFRCGCVDDVAVSRLAWVLWG